MIKFIFMLLAFAAVVNAYERHVNLPEGDIIQGKNSSGVIIRKKKTHVEVEWLEDFNYENSLKIYFNYVMENTGLREIVELDNLCGKYKRGTLDNSVKKFILSKLGITSKCPIKKGVKKITFPIKFDYQTETKECGPVYGLFNILRNNKEDPNTTPLLIV
ncbi:uncharacterized protein LOC122505593 [Leptopilina heterotoma]|uniref:uncharacterized protein LOC122505593 n=1 Tax=Leptopilina heterotoma TaxID=63436 RepID=UPI001CAA23EB|nr:uncharacterized protein LOC122505593 [Leptopilina heterotoma]